MTVKYSSQETVFSVDFMPKEYELEHLSETGDKELQEKKFYKISIIYGCRRI